MSYSAKATLKIIEMRQDSKNIQNTVFPNISKVFLVIIAAVLAGALFLLLRAFDLWDVRSFDECILAPGAVTEQTSPERCTLPNGQVYIKD